MSLYLEFKDLKEEIVDFESLRVSLSQYKSVISAIENQKCSHSDNFKYCCGISYEYFNDISCRSNIEKILNKNSPDIQNLIMKEIKPLDDRLKKLCREGSVWNEKANEWWFKFLPKGVAP